jgi:hypothetical protein
MLIVLIAFKILEELVVGWVHGNNPANLFSEFLERTWLQDVAPLLPMLDGPIASNFKRGQHDSSVPVTALA